MYVEDIARLRTLLVAMQAEDKTRGVLLFGSDKSRPSTEELQRVLALNHKPLLGGFFPEIIADGKRMESGFLLISLPELLEVVLFEDTTDVSGGNVAMARALEEELATSSAGGESVFCFFNAFWAGKSAFLEALYDQLGPYIAYLGGGAGSLSFESFPCIFANQSIVEHGAVVGFIKSAMTVGVAHGWHPISEPIKVTETRGSTIITLNWKPAYEVYQSLVEAHSGASLEADDFFGIAKSYPLGLVRLDDEMIIRDPYAATNGMLQLVDEVTEGEYIRIMHGNKPSLLEGAEHAVAESVKAREEGSRQFCIDCISRVLFMQEDFEEELAILNKHEKANGVLSIGEIGNPGNSALTLFNKTVVVAQW